MFADVETAEQVERAESELMRAAAAIVERREPDTWVHTIGGGVGVFAGVGSPLNKVAGLGFGGFGAGDEAAFTEHEAHVFERGAAVLAEVATLADPTVATWLTRRGYVHVGVENVLGRALEGDADGERASDVIVARGTPTDFDAWLAAVVDGFGSPDTGGVPAHGSFDRGALERVIADFALAAGVERFVARRNAAVAGGASLRTSGTVAQMCGAATLPHHRRRGVQSALLAARLAHAASCGCTLAVMTVQPGSRSARNGRARGFELLYARNVFVREPG
jgi:ribosomal protein S18 acetylase RimI-like enzyme